MKASAKIALGIAIWSCTGCGDVPAPGAEEAADPVRPVEAHSLLGEPLLRPQLADDFARRQETLRDMALMTLAERPRDPEAVIWAGRRTAYLGRYQQALWTYSRGIDAHPDEPRLYRHRGHRYITVRRLAASRFGFVAAEAELARLTDRPPR